MICAPYNLIDPDSGREVVVLAHNLAVHVYGHRAPFEFDGEFEAERFAGRCVAAGQRVELVCTPTCTVDPIEAAA